MDKVLGIIELVLYIVAILSLSAAATWLVIKVSPSEAAKLQKAQKSQKSPDPTI